VRRVVTNSSWLPHLNLVLALDQEFGIQFEAEEMNQVKTVGSIAELVQSKAG
jgi:acyl carrier protein